MIHAMGIFFVILLLLYILIVIYKRDTIRRADINVANRVSKKKKGAKKNATFCYKISYSSKKAFKKESSYKYNEILINLPL